ncbi:hypothetical protein [Candidatus Avelusimicrobium alvi]|uniref:hypothetical protein n=1 Tax=Candidatus Avelusimicrobium alvi TaxID=3416221 RepID=UPI003D13BBCA
MDDFLEEKKQPAQAPRHVFRLHRRLFLLVFAVAVLLQSLVFVDMRLRDYYKELDGSFKLILTVSGQADNAALEQMGESLNQKEDITAVRLFSPQDALEAVKRQNPQLTEALLLMGKNKMPAYFDLKLNYKAINNIRPFVDNLATEYPALTPHYNAQHAALLFYTGLCSKLLNLAVIFALLLFLAFMFLVEAYPGGRGRAHYAGGAVSGVLAGLASCVFFAVLVYPTGFLAEAAAQFTTPGRQLLMLAFCGLFGWTLSKWQKF